MGNVAPSQALGISDQLIEKLGRLSELKSVLKVVPVASVLLECHALNWPVELRSNVLIVRVVCQSQAVGPSAKRGSFLLKV